MNELTNATNTNIVDIDKFEKENRKCRVMTCIHCVGDRCTNDTCEIYERSFIQEG
ncbi:MAG: hypothetical protein N4A48_06375 [Tepidibacter sp.]|jgi:hypothetical protein|uniref:hypothetical protein n=1 Tax=Tepidibacter sp. TaxID=2529387 RepID=UPI0025CC7338|nr:hypothetical protein [Tepidibacter sp.]MCT4508376.1 hypothetical protein [Tepidibacter sp.]